MGDFLSPLRGAGNFFIEKVSSPFKKKNAETDKSIPRPKSLKAEAEQTMKEIKNIRAEVLSSKKAYTANEKLYDKKVELAELAGKIADLEVKGEYSPKDKQKLAKTGQKIAEFLDKDPEKIGKDARRLMNKGDFGISYRENLRQLILQFDALDSSVMKENRETRDSIALAVFKMGGYKIPAYSNRYIEDVKKLDMSKLTAKGQGEAVRYALAYIIEYSEMSSKERSEAIKLYKKLDPDNKLGINLH